MRQNERRSWNKTRSIRRETRYWISVSVSPSKMYAVVNPMTGNQKEEHQGEPRYQGRASTEGDVERGSPEKKRKSLKRSKRRSALRSRLRQTRRNDDGKLKQKGQREQARLLPFTRNYHLHHLALSPPNLPLLTLKAV